MVCFEDLDKSTKIFKIDKIYFSYLPPISLTSIRRNVQQIVSLLKEILDNVSLEDEEICPV